MRETAAAGCRLLRFANWEKGLAFRPDLGLSSFRAASRAKIRWVWRENGSAARRWLDELLASHRTSRRTARDHRGVADAIRGGWADAGVCHRLVSEQANLGFLRFPQEAYDLCYRADMESDPRLQAVVEIV